MREGKYAECSYELNVGGDQTEEVKGLYLICDGGYHRWRCMQAPTKVCVGDPQLSVFSRWLESVQKDVECTFGQVGE